MNPPTEEAQALSMIPTAGSIQRDPFDKSDTIEKVSEGEDHRLWEARRMIRAAKELTYDVLREERKVRQEKGEG
jgi:hypothetical protein